MSIYSVVDPESSLTATVKVERGCYAVAFGLTRDDYDAIVSNMVPSLPVFKVLDHRCASHPRAGELLAMELLKRHKQEALAAAWPELESLPLDICA